VRKDWCNFELKSNPKSERERENRNCCNVELKRNPDFHRALLMFGKEDSRNSLNIETDSKA
jgi:hypothetical protein